MTNYNKFVKYDYKISLVKLLDNIFNIFKSKNISIISINLNNINNKIKETLCMRITNNSYIITPISEKINELYKLNVSVINYDFKNYKCDIILN